MVSNHVCNDKTMRGWSRKLKNVQGAQNLKHLDFRANSPFSLNSRGSGGIWEDLEGFQWILKLFPYEMSPKSYPNAPQALASTRKHSKTFCSIPAHSVHPFATGYGPENTISGGLRPDLASCARQIQEPYLLIRYTTVSHLTILLDIYNIMYD